jgi:hypothetical protein
MILRLKQTADTPAFHAAVKQVSSRLLSQGGIQLFHRGVLMIPSADMRSELDRTYAQLVDGAVIQLMTYGIAFACISGGSSFDDDDDGTSTDPKVSSTDEKSVSEFVQTIRWGGSPRGELGARTGGYTVVREKPKPRPFILDM